MKRRQFLATSTAASLAAGFSGSLLAAVEAMSEVKGDLAAVTGGGASISLTAAEVEELKAALRGRLLLPGNAGYDAARKVLNASIDRHPALIVQPTGAADVMSAVQFARAHDLLLAVKCGGHSFSGKSTCEGGLQIDLSTFRDARFDPVTRTCHVAGGSLLGELDHETLAQGMATTAGTVSHTGVGGLTTGGGFGRLARRFGLALDNVRSVDVVTADGKLVHASADENPDLYWGVRGGGGNFGVVTNFEFDLHPMQRTVVGGDVVFPDSEIRNVLSFYADYAASCPDELYLDFVAMSQPGSDAGAVILHACWSGDEDKAEAAIAPVLKAGTVLNNGIGRIDYEAIQRAWDNTDPRTVGEYVKGGFVESIPAALIDDMVAGYKPEQGMFLLFQHSGGAINRVAPDATAMPHRYAMANLVVSVSWPLDQAADPHIAYLRDYWSKLERHTYGWYTNEVSNEAPAAINSNYQGNYERLVQVKNRWDPTNLFRLNANVRPTV